MRIGQLTMWVVLTISSCLIATFGLISNSTAVIIGAMIIAPLMLPLRGLAFGALQGDLKLFRSRFRRDRRCDNHSISSLVADGTDCCLHYCPLPIAYCLLPSA